MSGPELMKRLRAERQLSQYDLAKVVDLTPGAISQIETERIRPRRDSAERIDSALGAGGAVVRAFGYVDAAGEDDVDNVTRLVLEVTRLARVVQLLTDEARERLGDESEFVARLAALEDDGARRQTP